jgi:hypothetical protein
LKYEKNEAKKIPMIEKCLKKKAGTENLRQEAVSRQVKFFFCKVQAHIYIYALAPCTSLK